MYRVLVVDDHAMMRKGVIQTLTEAEDLEITCDEASDARETLEKIAAYSYDMVLLDIAMPGVNGLELLKQLHQDQPELAILLLSMYPEEQFAIRALSLGAVGYLTKVSAADELTIAAKKVLSGGRYISPSLGEKMAVHLGSGKKSCELPHESLSGRESQIFLMIGSGKSPTEMANELFISIKTVSTYRARILEKMDMKNNAEIIGYAIKHGLVC
jgi:two-component system, NarL family, invasion response regulator UvrY